MREIVERFIELRNTEDSEEIRELIFEISNKLSIDEFTKIFGGNSEAGILTISEIRADIISYSYRPNDKSAIDMRIYSLSKYIKD